MAENYGQTTKVFKAFCDEKRLRILELLQDGEKCACVLMEALDIPQSSLSYHMKVLCESGIVVGRQSGKWTHYHICEQGSKRAQELLGQLTETREPEQENACECSADCPKADD